MIPLYRYDEGRGAIEAGYPRDMRNWRGVPLHIDGAITWRDGTMIHIICTINYTSFQALHISSKMGSTGGSMTTW